MKTIKYELSIEFKEPPTLKDNPHIKNSIRKAILDEVHFTCHPLHKNNIASINIYKEGDAK